MCSAATHNKHSALGHTHRPTRYHTAGKAIVIGIARRQGFDKAGGGGQLVLGEVIGFTQRSQDIRAAADDMIGIYRAINAGRLELHKWGRASLIRCTDLDDLITGGGNYQENSGGHDGGQVGVSVIPAE